MNTKWTIHNSYPGAQRPMVFVDLEEIPMDLAQELPDLLRPSDLACAHRLTPQAK
jgi:hypothetical protein